MAVLAMPIHTVSEDTANIEELVGDLAATAVQYEILTTKMARRAPEIVETVVTEIVDKETFPVDCTTLWAVVFGSEMAIRWVDAAAMIPEFECSIHAQYQNHSQETIGHPPAG
jgi:hypothetical protein